MVVIQETIVEAEKSNRDYVKRTYTRLAAKVNLSVIFNKSRSYGQSGLKAKSCPEAGLQERKCIETGSGKNAASI
jgi:hypothetical protein